MIDNTKIQSTLPHWLDTSKPASDTLISKLVSATDFTLAPAYLQLLRLTDGGETFLADDDSDNGSYLVLWPSSDVLTLNDSHEIPTCAPKYFAFGTNGSGELFAFDTTRNDDAVFMLPEIGISADAAMLYCHSFSAFLSLLPRSAG